MFSIFGFVRSSQKKPPSLVKNTTIRVIFVAISVSNHNDCTVKYEFKSTQIPI